MEIQNPGEYSAADAFALAMLCMMFLSMGVIALLFFTIGRSAGKRNAQVDELIDEVTNDAKDTKAPQATKDAGEEPAAAPGKAVLEEWEKEPDWWKKTKP